MVKRGLKVGIFLGVIILLIVPMASAGIFGWFKEKVQMGPGFNVSITMANSAPTIVNWTSPLNGGTPFRPSCLSYGPNISIGTPNSGVFNVTISDPNNCGDFTSGGWVRVYVHRNGVYRNGGSSPVYSSNCALIASTCTGQTDMDVVYDCSGLVNMTFYDNSSTNWIINVSANDGDDFALNNGQQSNGSIGYPNFTYGVFPCPELMDDNDPTAPLDTIQWTGVNLQFTRNATSLTNLTTRNWGNLFIDQISGFMQIKAGNLNTTGVVDEINVSSFGVDELTDPCHAAGRQTLQNYSINVSGASLPIGTDSNPNRNETFYFCLAQPTPKSGSTLTSGDYVSKPNEWEINLCQLC